MKVILHEDPHKISISEIGEELKKHPYQVFEYGDYGNWVTALLLKSEVDKIKDNGENAIYRYTVAMKDTFLYIGKDGTICPDEEVGFDINCLNDLGKAFIKIDGYCEIVEEDE